ncbi:GDSL esterase/lipase At1g29670-like [Henckelia pumila]|uniref:GDSL esterase/lipase At1g29670-like n=1 Tax=Henckelia pumila TaxID=405737 RepID=UPI003C6DCD23
MAYIIANPKWVVIRIIIICFFMQSRVYTSLLSQQQVSCLFFFGASLTDNGNNNILSTLLKANYLPYGIDFPAGPTGRFSNGQNIPDFIAKLLGFSKPIPPFATATGSDIVKGVNYASAGAGILNETGKALGDNISMNKQLSNHQITISRLATLLGPSQVQAYLNTCVYTVEMASNDYVNNYIQPQNYPSTASFTPDQFAAFLIQQFTTQLQHVQALYTSGARKVAIYGLAQLGCIPQVLTMFPANASGCVDFVNDYVQLFNNRLKPLVDNLNANLAGAIFTYINISSISSINPSNLGITILNSPCCVVSSVGVCVPNRAPCIDPDLHIFFDNYHTTEIVNAIIAYRSYKSLLPNDAYPYDIKHLAQQ